MYIHYSMFVLHPLSGCIVMLSRVAGLQHVNLLNRVDVAT